VVALVGDGQRSSLGLAIPELYSRFIDFFGNQGIPHQTAGLLIEICIGSKALFEKDVGIGVVVETVDLDPTGAAVKAKRLW
jgi:hypothetical protein